MVAAESAWGPGSLKDVNAKLMRQPDPFVVMICVFVHCAMKFPFMWQFVGKELKIGDWLIGFAM